MARGSSSPSEVLAVRRDADHGYRSAHARSRIPEGVADGVSVAKQSARQVLVENRDPGRTLPVGRHELAPGHDRNPHGPEVVRPDVVVVEPHPRWLRARVREDLVSADGVAVQGNHTGDAGRLDAGERAQHAQGGAGHAPRLFLGWVFFRYQPHRGPHGVVARAHRHRLGHVPDEENAHRQQHDRHRELHHDQPAAQVPAALHLPLGSFQRRADAAPSRLQGGQRAGDEGARDGDHRRVQEQPPVRLYQQMHGYRQRKLQVVEDAGQPQVEQEPGPGAQESQEQALGQELADDPGAARAEGEPNRQLLPAGRCSGQQQVRGQRLPDHVGLGPQPGPPEAIAEDDDVSIPRLDRSPHRQRHPYDTEEVVRDAHRVQAVRLVARAPVGLGFLVAAREAAKSWASRRKR